MDSLQPDDIIQGRYRIVRKIGQGGFGAVYEAIDQRLNSRVALKHLLLAGDHVVRAFRREAELLAGLRNPALPRVSDFFTDDRGQFLVMDYIDGDDLAVALAQRGTPFRLDEVLDWADRLLGTLTYLHTRTPPILHRDIKPQNLKVLPPDELVLLDFGLAKGSIAASDGTSMLLSIHAYTPGYAPPEQIDGSGTDARSDLYALAATLYHLLTGIVPADALSRVTAIPRRQPDPLRPLHEVNPAIPLSVSNVLMGALALHPDDRPQSAMVMRLALQSVDRDVVGAVLPPASEPSAPLTEFELLELGTIAPSNATLDVQQDDAAPVRPPTPTNDIQDHQESMLVSQQPLQAYEDDAPPPTPSRTRWWIGLVGAVMVVALLVTLVISFPTLRTGIGTVAGLETAGSVSTANPSTTVNLDAVQRYSNLSRDHIEGSITYDPVPPIGGAHNGAWLTCGIYDEPVPNENAVHSLEHGAVWITYDPSLSATDVETLRGLVRGHRYALLSPYPGIPSPVVASAWGVQLRMNSASDARLALFIQTYENGAQTPEQGASCRGSVGSPVE